MAKKVITTSTDAHLKNNIDFIKNAREYAELKNLNFNEVIDSAELAISASESRRYFYDKIVTSIDRESGSIAIYRKMIVVDNDNYDLKDEEGFLCIRLEDALKINEECEVGSLILEQMPDLESFRGRIKLSKSAFQDAIKVSLHKKMYEEFKGLIGEIVVGVVKKVGTNELVIDVFNMDIVLPNNYLLRSDNYRTSSRIKAYVVDVIKDKDDLARVNLSRKHPNFIKVLMEQEIPEIYEKTIEVKHIVRIPGSRSKVAVISKDSNIDPVGCCVGIKGSRIKNVSNELGGEKIDVVSYSDDIVKFALNAIYPHNAKKILLDQEKKSIEIVVPESSVSSLIGKGGQNVFLISSLIGCRIDILSFGQEEEKRKNESVKAVNSITQKLDVEEDIANLLLENKIMSIKDIILAGHDKLSSIEEFDDSIAEELIARANIYIKNNPINPDNIVDDKTSIYDLEIESDMLESFRANGVMIASDIADLAVDEFMELTNNRYDKEIINRIIIECRKNLKWI